MHVGVESLMPKGVEHKMIDTGLITILGVESLMPKGVEHILQLTILFKINTSVESLMPKGVEHQKEVEEMNASELCRISDAERR